MSYAYSRSGRSMWGLWGFLSLAAAGFATLAAGIYLESNQWVGLGTGLFTLAGMGFLLVQFWKAGTAHPVGLPRAVPAATQVLPVPALVPLTAPPTGDDLVEFQLVDEKEAPTSLEVPAAFQLESSVNAAPPEPDPVAVFPWLAKDASGASQVFAHAAERRKEMVQGLPILSSVFSGDSAPTREPASERPGRTRGQCGGCGTMLWAPTQRPLRLRCPKCGHVRTLTE